MYISPNEISKEELTTLVEKSYESFRHPDVTPLRKLEGNQGNRYILELWHGPTYAFKDVALQLLGNLFEFFLQRRNAAKKGGEERERLTVVGATSGDTGRYVRSFFIGWVYLNCRKVLQFMAYAANQTFPSIFYTPKDVSLPFKRHR